MIYPKYKLLFKWSREIYFSPKTITKFKNINFLKCFIFE